MPSKGKRVASRQNNLRRRRASTASRTPATREPAVAEVATSVAQPSPGAPVAESASAVGAQAAPATATSSATRPAAQARGRRSERPTAYNYVGSELTRIGIFSVVSLVALIAVSFVL